MDEIDFLTPVQTYIKDYLVYNLNRYPRYQDWPGSKVIPYLSNKAIEKWQKAVTDYATRGNPLPVEVIDSWADMYGVTGYGGVLHTFRGTAEHAIKGWMPKDLRD